MMDVIKHFNNESESANRPVLVATQLTWDDYKKYALFSYFRKKSHTLPLLIVSGSLIILLLPILALTMLVVGFDTSLILCFLAIVALLVLYGLAALFYVYRAKQLYRTSTVQFQSAIQYRFNTDDFSIEHRGPQAAGIASLKYGALYRVYETSHGIYLFINTNQAYLIPKRSVGHAQLAQLTALLKSKLNNRYITR